MTVCIVITHSNKMSVWLEECVLIVMYMYYMQLKVLSRRESLTCIIDFDEEVKK